MRVGIVRYPGSNCDTDTKRYFKDSFYIWHKETKLPQLDLLVIPGGFAFGDRNYLKATGEYEIDPGKMAVKSPVTGVIMEAYKKKIPILGICNGFQILIKLGLLPGSLVQNSDRNFHSRQVECVLEPKGIKRPIQLNIANSFGCYSIDTGDYTDLVVNKQIFLSYKEFDNGSFQKIAGVSNKERTVYGMMPHPERTTNYFKTWLFKQFQPTDIYSRVDRLIKSEHISYKSTKKFLSKLYTEGEHVVQGPGENAGIVDIGGGYCVAMRIESHNHPIFIDPYNGAATGVGGIMRDIFTMGARPIAIMDFLRFGNDQYNDSLYPMVIKGISDYGNCFGVANVGGDFYRDDTYNKNPLLNVACLGLVKKENIIYGNVMNTDSLLIYVGSKTAKEGVDGAFMASNQFGEDVSGLKDNIQTGDPYLEKLLMEACCEISDKKLAEGMQDMGAGGLLCASVEVVKRGRDKTGKNIGCEIYLDKVPIKYAVDNCDILISESQERMLIVAQEKNKEEIFGIFEKWDLEYSVVGMSNNTGYYSVLDNSEEIYVEHIDMFEAEKVDLTPQKQAEQMSEPIKIKNTELWTQYDNTIGGRTIKGPLEPGHYAILDIFEINRKIILSWGDNIDTCKKIIGKNGGRPLGVVNCLNFGDPKQCIGNFCKETEILNSACVRHSIPVIGGNVSLYNSTNNVPIKPTVVLVMLGII
tara:strand:- start:1132 stop:3219 length:2088 start_codon:yes stop_codon:yes gene_type:complete